MSAIDPLFRVRIDRPECTITDRLAADRDARRHYGDRPHRWLGCRRTRNDQVIHYYAQEARP